MSKKILIIAIIVYIIVGILGILKAISMDIPDWFVLLMIILFILAVINHLED